MKIVEMLAENFNIKNAFKVALFVRHRSNKKFKAERIYLDDILQNIPKERKKEKIVSIFSQKLLDYGFENEHYVFLVYGVSPEKIKNRSEGDVFVDLDNNARDAGLNLGGMLSSYFFYDDDDEIFYFSLGYLSSMDLDLDVLDRFLNCHIWYGDDNKIKILCDPFFVRKDAKAIINVYDDRGMDVVLSVD